MTELKYRVICAWCKKLIREVTCDLPPEADSHGICDECLEKELKEK